MMWRRSFAKSNIRCGLSGPAQILRNTPERAELKPVHDTPRRFMPITPTVDMREVGAEKG